MQSILKTKENEDRDRGRGSENINYSHLSISRIIQTYSFAVRNGSQTSFLPVADYIGDITV